MDTCKLTVKISYHILSDVNGVITVAFFANDYLCHIIAGESYQMIHRLDDTFNGDE